MTFTFFKSDAAIFWALLKTKLTVLRKLYPDKVINLLIWVSCTVLVTAYVMPAFGISRDFGTFQLIGDIASVALFESYGCIATLIMDFCRQQTINYYLTLPVTARMVFGNIVCYYTIVYTSLEIIIIPLGKLLLWDRFSLGAICWGKFFLILIIANIFFATLALLLAAIIDSMERIETVWTRFIFPLWFLGGFQFSWHIVNGISKPLSYIMLANPVTYVMEGLRASTLGQSGYINYWICLLVICLFSLVTGALAYRKLKKRLDFV